jgi:hypothetical protein
MLAYEEILVAKASTQNGVRNVVLVHGGFVDGSGWKGGLPSLEAEWLYGPRATFPGAINLLKDQGQTLKGLRKDKTNVLYCYSQVCHLMELDGVAGRRFRDRKVMRFSKSRVA